jgi:hypothetical protein
MVQVQVLWRVHFKYAYRQRDRHGELSRIVTNQMPP